MNHQIRAQQVRLIDENGEQLGIKSIGEALNEAQQRELDLVEIAPQANPPVCKIIDYSKFRYEQEKKVREARKKQKTSQLKEVRMRPRIGGHDFEIKLQHAREFLEERNKVQFTILFMGREMHHREVGLALVDKIKTALADIADVENRPSMMGNRLIVLMNPKKVDVK